VVIHLSLRSSDRLLVVGAATPSFAPLILAILSFVAAAIQVLGFIGVAKVSLVMLLHITPVLIRCTRKEKTILYRRYVSLHCLATLATFAVAAAWIILSATRHSTAESKCLNDFFLSGDAAQTSEGNVLCNIFPWVDIGVMCGLWVVLGILHVRVSTSHIFFPYSSSKLYLYTVLSSYGSSQRRDHEKYDQLHNDSIAMNRRNDPWDSRHSTDSLYSPANRSAHGYNHIRQESGGSVSDMVAQPPVQPHDALANPHYQQGQYSSLGHKEYDDDFYDGMATHREMSHA
jgi:hypothetical protein